MLDSTAKRPPGASQDHREPTRIIIADPHELHIEGLSRLLRDREEFSLIGAACDGRRALRLIMEETPDLVFIESVLPGLNGPSVTRQALRKSPHTRIVALSAYAQRRFVTGMLEAGACGYLLKSCTFDELLQAVKVVTRGDVYLSPGVTSTVVGDFVRQTRTPRPTNTATLTRRELDILELLVNGRTRRHIASELGVSARTVDTHRLRIMKKLGVRNVAALTKYAIREGLTSPDT